MELTRRTFLRSSGVALAGAQLAPLGLSLPAIGRATATGKALVLIFLRGGADGLNILVPYADPDYYDLRSSLAIARPGAEGGALDLDGSFGLHPAAEPLLRRFESGVGVGVHAVGNPRNTRSHFAEQDTWETAVLDGAVSADGWLNRHLQSSDGRGPVRAVSFGDALPRVLRGDVEAYAVRSLTELESGEEGATALAALQRAHAGDGGSSLMAESGREALDALRELRKIAAAPYEARVEYPSTGLATRLRDVARTLRADVGLEVAALDLGGWDTHLNQGGAAGGPHAQLVAELSGGIDAFLEDVEDRLGDVLVLVVSEFGRTAAENGTRGTDHGWANCALAFGGPVLGAGDGVPRKLVGEWPGLAADQLNERRDLRHTTDFRDLIAEVVEVHLGNDRTDLVLPGHEARRVGVV